MALDCGAQVRVAFHLAQASLRLEVLPSSEEAWVYLAMIRLMVRRLAQDST
jgi:hypothetical protein